MMTASMRSMILTERLVSHVRELQEAVEQLKADVANLKSSNPDVLKYELERLAQKNEQQ